jgi:hypothetical protein
LGDSQGACLLPSFQTRNDEGHKIFESVLQYDVFLNAKITPKAQITQFHANFQSTVTMNCGQNAEVIAWAIRSMMEDNGVFTIYLSEGDTTQ